MIEMSDYWKGRDTQFASQLTGEIRANAENTVLLVNELLERSGYKSIGYLSSGWRPPDINERTANAAHGSNHLTGKAADIPDSDRSFAGWCVDNLDVLKELGLWMEDPRWTFAPNGQSWVHVQTVPPRSGHRVYIPSTAAPRDPSFPVTWVA